jgi:hypothetical protein
MDQTYASVAFADRRRAAAAELTRLLEQHPSFSYLRLGDGEVQCLEAVRAGKKSPRYHYEENGASSIELTYSVSGIGTDRVPRLIQSYDDCSFLDYCDSIPVVRGALARLPFKRSADALRNEGPETSNIIFEWTSYEMTSYMARHRCLIASAESALLRELSADPAFRELAKGHFEPHSGVFFHQVRNDGRFFSENLDLIKEDLIKEIRGHDIDTLFLSLASGAKILCCELARELRIRAVDFGSMPRALAYAGSPGYHTARDYHCPFLFRVPFPIFMGAFVRAHPNTTLAEQVAKAHSQFHLDLLDLRPFTFNNSDGVAGHRLRPSPEGLRRFRESWRHYQTMYMGAALKDRAAWQLHKDFRYWCLKKGIGWQGRLFLLGVRAKGCLRRILASLPRGSRKTPA